MDSKEPNSERPPDSDFQQQNLKAWQPLLTPSWVIVTFFLVSVIFIPIGAVILEASANVKIQDLRYDTSCNGASVSPPCNYTLNMNIVDNMEPPIYFYYKLTNFYQNHRRYVKSRSDQQLRGEKDAQLSSCDPLQKNDGKDIYPCGLIANSYFNDTFPSFTIVNKTGGSTVVDKTDKGIAWASDVADKYKEIPSSQIPKTWTRVGPGNFVLPNVTDEDFIVWMRTAGLPYFKKLRYIIRSPLRKGDILSINLTNVFPVAGFKGEKYVVISTTSWLGGKNDFLGWAYVIVGCLCFLLALLFLLKHCAYERPLGDMHYFNWANNRNGERKE